MVKIKKAVCMAVAMFVTVCSVTINPKEVQASDFWPEGPSVESASAILMEASTGTVLYEKNSMDQHYPASITKIMTTLLAIENGKMDDIVTFSEDSVYKTEGSGIARDVGEQMTLEQCLYAVMLNSANECAYAVAEHIGGTVDNFVSMMNERAAEIGCQNTHFNNPHGLQDENHYTCASDMALIAREAWQNETFRIITGTSTYTIPPTNKHTTEETFLQNHHAMLYPLKTTKYLYDYCVGGKTGYTTAANSTLVTYAQKDGMTLICVVMDVNSPGQWTDTRALFDYGFDNFQVLNIADNETRFSGGNKDAGELITNQDFVEIEKSGSVVIPKTANFSDAVPTVDDSKASKDVAGTIYYTYADRNVGSADIITTNASVKQFDFSNAASDTEESTEVTAEQEKDKTIRVNFRVVLRVIIGIIAGVVVILLIILLISKIRIWRNRISFQKKPKSPYKTIKSSKRRRRRRRRR